MKPVQTRQRYRPPEDQATLANEPLRDLETKVSAEDS
jgi:hypothetical protein